MPPKTRSKSVKPRVQPKRGRGGQKGQTEAVANPESLVVRVPVRSIPQIYTSSSSSSSEEEECRSSKKSSKTSSEDSGIFKKPGCRSRPREKEVDHLEEISRLQDELAKQSAARELELIRERRKLNASRDEVEDLSFKISLLQPDDAARTEEEKKLKESKGRLAVCEDIYDEKDIQHRERIQLLENRIEFHKEKQVMLIEDRKSARGSSSVSHSSKRRRTQSWIDSQQQQQFADEAIARKLEEEINNSELELRKKKDKLRSIYSVSSSNNVMPPPPPRKEASVVQIDNALSVVLARQNLSRDLPYFDGSPAQWVRFRAQFNKTTKSCRFSDEENLVRLEKCLKGEALNAVKSLMFTENNVPVIMKKLEKIYGNPEIIIDKLIEDVEKLPTVKEGRPDMIIEFGTAVTNLTATLQALGRQEHIVNPRLIKDLQKKLPYHEEMKWIAYSKNMGRNLQTFSDWIEEEVENARMSGHIRKSEKSDDSRRERDQRKYPHKTANRCLNTSEKPEERNQDRRRRCCFICEKEGHFADKCQDFLKKTSEERMQIAREKNLCTSCLIPGHRQRECRKKKACGERGCRQEHHPLLHNGNTNRRQTPPPSTTTDAVSNASPTVEVTNHRLLDNDRILMGAVPVVLSGPTGEVACLAFLDSGSEVTLLKNDIAMQLGLTGPTQPLCIKTLTSNKTYEESILTSVGIRGNWNQAKTFQMATVRTVDCLPVGKLSQDAKELKEKFPYLRSLPIASFKNEEPGILIGVLHIELCDTQRYVRSQLSGPRAMKCPLGWRVAGATVQKLESTGAVFHTCFKMSSEDTLASLIKSSYTVEDFGVKVLPTLQSAETIRSLKILQETTKRVVGTDRYETGLLWRRDDIVLPESRRMALYRLQCQERKMDRDPAFAEAYVKKINENFGKGFYKRLTPEEAAVKNSRTWYLPHFGVWNPNKPGKLRLVFDAAAQSEGVSMNSVLLPGPDINNSLIAVLMRFRQFQYAYAGDIKDMYHRIYVKEDERSSQRFLWRGMRRDIPPVEFEMIVLTFGSTCSPASAQYVKNINADENCEEFPEATSCIKQNMYVDDLLGSSATLGSAKRMVKDIVDINQKGGFLTCNWNANDPAVLALIDEDLKCSEIKEISERQEHAAERVLGLWWDSRKDEFTFRLKMHKVPKEILEKKRRPTKREVLCVTNSVYDPLGFVAHLTVKAKILYQALWTKGTGWDDEIPDEIYSKWNLWLDELHEIESVRVRRCYSTAIPIAEYVDLHIFCDASEKAFVAIAFLRIQSANGVEVSIVAAKTRLAPVKMISVPRLELQGAVMATRLAATVKKELTVPVTSTTFWTDSTTVLKWIRSEARDYKSFVAHRISEILDSSNVVQWRYVPTKENVADDATRDDKPCDLKPTSRWINGPPFLKLSEDNWPKEKFTSSLEEIDEERKVTVMVTKEKGIQEAQIGFLTNCSKWTRMTRIAAQLLRIPKFWKKYEKGQSTGCSSKSQEFSVEELEKAEEFLVRQSQQETFLEEIETLKKGQDSCVSNKSKIRALEPYLGYDGILRIKGRLSRSTDDMDYKHPAIIDGNHHLAEVIIQWYHENCAHQGQRTVAYLIRQKFWITGGMSTIKRVFRNCLECQRRTQKIGEARMADLPLCRIESVRPFYNTGMDYFGPIFVTVKRSQVKRWGVIFTCLATRAVHIEIASSLNTDSAIMAIVNFSSRRGRPKHIYSDNGTNFHGARNELRKAMEEMDSDEMSSRLTMKEMTWHFNPPSAPHMGGAWERLVGSIKRAMENLVKNTRLTDDILRNTLCQVEYILNSRPLLEVPVDPKDPLPITPNDILLGWQRRAPEVEAREEQPIWGKFEDGDLWSRQAWRASQRLADIFWSRWQKEYLPSLNKRQKWIKTKDPIQEGDVVLVVDDNAPRHSWPLGRVITTYPGKDGTVRMVDVKTSTSEYRRPISKLIKLLTSKDNKVPLLGGRMCGEHEDKANNNNDAEADSGGGVQVRGEEGAGMQNVVECDG